MKHTVTLELAMIKNVMSSNNALKNYKTVLCTIWNMFSRGLYQKRILLILAITHLLKHSHHQHFPVQYQHFLLRCSLLPWPGFLKMLWCSCTVWMKLLHVHVFIIQKRIIKPSLYLCLSPSLKHPLPSPSISLSMCLYHMSVGTGGTRGTVPPPPIQILRGGGEGQSCLYTMWQRFEEDWQFPWSCTCTRHNMQHSTNIGHKSPQKAFENMNRWGGLCSHFNFSYKIRLNYVLGLKMCKISSASGGLNPCQFFIFQVHNTVFLNTFCYVVVELYFYNCCTFLSFRPYKNSSEKSPPPSHPIKMNLLRPCTMIIIFDTHNSVLRRGLYWTTTMLLCNMLTISVICF